jgi:transaldolase
MNAADQTLLNWLNTQINSGKRSVTVPAELLKHTTSEGLTEARRLAKLCGVELVVRA